MKPGTTLRTQVTDAGTFVRFAHWQSADEAPRGETPVPVEQLESREELSAASFADAQPLVPDRHQLYQQALAEWEKEQIKQSYTKKPLCDNASSRL